MLKRTHVQPFPVVTDELASAALAFFDTCFEFK